MGIKEAVFYEISAGSQIAAEVKKTLYLASMTLTRTHKHSGVHAKELEKMAQIKQKQSCSIQVFHVPNKKCQTNKGKKQIPPQVFQMVLQNRINNHNNPSIPPPEIRILLICKDKWKSVLFKKLLVSSPQR